MKKVLLTGGSKGIGKAIMEVFEANGYTVIAPSHSEMDLSDTKSVMDYIEKNKDESFDVIINNAGINEIGLIEEITDEVEVGRLEVDVDVVVATDVVVDVLVVICVVVVVCGVAPTMAESSP